MDWEKRPNTTATKICRYHPLKTFLWGYVKDRVYRTLVSGIIALQSQIIDVLATVTKEIQNTSSKIEDHLDLMRATNRA